MCKNFVILLLDQGFLTRILTQEFREGKFASVYNFNAKNG